MRTFQHTTAIRFLTGFLMLALAMAERGECQTPPAGKELELLAVLKGNAPAADKALACKGIAIYGSEASVTELAKLLPDSQLASWARIALEAIPGTAADEALRQATESLKGTLLVGVINSIGVRRDPAAVELLIAHMRQDAEVDVAMAAAIALGHIGNAKASQALRQTLPDAPKPLRTAVAEACILCAEKYLSTGSVEEAVAIYDEVRHAEVPRQRKLEATRGAILARKEAGIPLLVEQLRSEDRSMFRLALTVAREMPGSALTKALVAELGSAEPERAALIITAMADRPETVELPVILKAAGPGPKPVRQAAISALGRIGNETCLSTLLDAALDSDKEIQQTGREALAMLPGDKVNSEIEARLQTAQGEMYRLLIEVVGLRFIPAIPALVKALSHEDAAVRAAALASLGATVDTKNLNVLISSAIAPQAAEDGAVALQALKTASIRMPDREACAAELTAALDRAPAATKDSFLEILSEMGGATALQTIGAAAKSNDPQLQDTGSRLLGKWPTEDAAPVLLDLAKASSSDKYHVRAIRGYISLARRFATMPEARRLEICQNTLSVARHSADKKLALEVLKLYPSLEGLKLAILSMEIPDLKEDASQAARAIAPKVKGNADQVRDILSKAGLDKAD